MTTYQSMMLSVCFGDTVGFLISGLVLSIKYWLEQEHKEPLKTCPLCESDSETAGQFNGYYIVHCINPGCHMSNMFISDHKNEHVINEWGRKSK